MDQFLFYKHLLPPQLQLPPPTLSPGQSTTSCIHLCLHATTCLSACLGLGPVTAPPPCHHLIRFLCRLPPPHCCLHSGFTTTLEPPPPPGSLDYLFLYRGVPGVPTRLLLYHATAQFCPFLFPTTTALLPAMPPPTVLTTCHHHLPSTAWVPAILGTTPPPPFLPATLLFLILGPGADYRTGPLPDVGLLTTTCFLPCYHLVSASTTPALPAYHLSRALCNFRFTAACASLYHLVSATACRRPPPPRLPVLDTYV